MTTYISGASNLFINTKREQYNNNAKDRSEFSILDLRRAQNQARTTPSSQTARRRTQACPKGADRPRAAEKGAAQTTAPAKKVKRTGAGVPNKTIGTSAKAPALTAAQRAKSGTIPAQGRAIKVITRKTGVKKPFPITFISYSIIFTVLFMFLLLSFSRINEYTIEINRVKNEISEQYKEQVRLGILIDARDDLRYIEQVASERLGMVKSGSPPKQYVNIAGEDKLEITKAEKNTLDMGVIMSGVTELFEAFFGN